MVLKGRGGDGGGLGGGVWNFHIAISPSPTRDDREKGKIKSGHLKS